MDCCKSLLSDLDLRRQVIVEDAQTLLTSRFTGRMTVGDEETARPAWGLKEQYNQLFDEVTCAGRIRRATGLSVCDRGKIARMGRRAGGGGAL